MSQIKPIFKYSSPVSKKFDEIGRIKNILKPQKKSRRARTRIAIPNDDNKEYDSDDTFIQRPRINIKKSLYYNKVGHEKLKGILNIYKI